MTAVLDRQPKLHRRTLLRNGLAGMGAVAIGLPLLEEMMLSSAAAAESQVPVRAFNVFFGLGIPAPLQEEGYEGVFEPLKPLQDKLAILRSVDHVRCDQSGINAHFDGSAAAFTAEPPDGEAKSGGPSIDQVVRETHYPDGLPPGMVPTLIGGTFFRRSRISRYVHSYRSDGTVAATMQEKPRDLFERVFGTVAVQGEDEQDFVQRRLQRSVLDSVVQQYKLFTGERSPLGKASRARVADHMDRVREFEQRAYQMSALQDGAPELPPASKLLHGGVADPGGEGIDITLAELTGEWRLMADLYALAIEMDRARFGSLTFLAAGERIRLTGDYEYDGRKIFSFDDQRQHNKSGSGGCSHEWWHKFSPEKKNTELRAHVHMKLREVAYFLNRLDETQESNGRSILENSMISVSTESGDGRHNDVKRELSGVFHAITGANGRFKTGQISDIKGEGIDVYNTMLDAMGCRNMLGPENRESREIGTILT
ncbi:MAG: DUF1552 domain-containing protein [Planctomycetota bacterium]